jgi:rod shape determining protein RodA
MDPLLTVLTAGLLVVSLSFIYGAGRQMGGDYAFLWRKQSLWILLGVTAQLVVVLVDLRFIGRYSWAFYSFGLALLVVVLLIGKEINGARSWLGFGPFTLQVAELMKPAAIVALAWVASRPGIRMERGDRLLVVAGMTALPVLLIAKQPDFGTALIFLPIAFVMLFLGGIRWKWIGMFVLAVALTAPVAYQVALAPHQRDRIRTFFDPSADITGAGYNAYQSMLAVGSGGIRGKGYGNGTQYLLGYLPRAVAPTDFIFSVISEETGFIGSATLLAALLGIVLCALRTAAITPDSFGAYAAVGVATLIFVHAFVNVGMCVRVTPIIGMPLPLVSYGGSFMLATLISLGLVQNAYVNHRQESASA